MNSNSDCLTRKRIWEVDCLSLDAAMAASFDWRDLINLLQGHGHRFATDKPDAILEIQAQCLAHEYCHSENPVSLTIEQLLNDWHADILADFAARDLSQIAEQVLTVQLEPGKKFGALFWALGSDPRPGLDCIRRRFHQKFQIFSIRAAQRSL